MMLHLDVELSDPDWAYVSGAVIERGQHLSEFVRDALLAHASF